MSDGQGMGKGHETWAAGPAEGEMELSTHYSVPVLAASVPVAAVVRTAALAASLMAATEPAATGIIFREAVAAPAWAVPSSIGVEPSP